MPVPTDAELCSSAVTGSFIRSMVFGGRVLAVSTSERRRTSAAEFGWWTCDSRDTPSMTPLEVAAYEQLAAAKMFRPFTKKIANTNVVGLVTDRIAPYLFPPLSGDTDHPAITVTDKRGASPGALSYGVYVPAGQYGTFAAWFKEWLVAGTLNFDAAAWAAFDADTTMNRQTVVNLPVPAGFLQYLHADEWAIAPPVVLTNGCGRLVVYGRRGSHRVITPLSLVAADPWVVWDLLAIS